MQKFRKSLSHLCKPFGHQCKPLSHQCKRPFLHFRTRGPNELSHSPLTTLGQFGGFDSSPYPLGSQVWASFYSVVMGERWTGSTNKSIDQIGKNCPKNVRKLCFQTLRTIFGHFSDNFWTFFRHFVDIPFSGLSNDLPVTTCDSDLREVLVIQVLRYHITCDVRSVMFEHLVWNHQTHTEVY